MEINIHQYVLLANEATSGHKNNSIDGLKEMLLTEMHFHFRSNLSYRPRLLSYYYNGKPYMNIGRKY